MYTAFLLSLDAAASNSDSLGHSAARFCVEAGATVAANVFLRHFNHILMWRIDDRRSEVIAHGGPARRRRYTSFRPPIQQAARGDTNPTQRPDIATIRRLASGMATVVPQ